MSCFTLWAHNNDVSNHPTLKACTSIRPLLLPSLLKLGISLEWMTLGDFGQIPAADHNRFILTRTSLLGLLAGRDRTITATHASHIGESGKLVEKKETKRNSLPKKYEKRHDQDSSSSGRAALVCVLLFGPGRIARLATSDQISGGERPSSSVGES